MDGFATTTEEGFRIGLPARFEEPPSYSDLRVKQTRFKGIVGSARQRIGRLKPSIRQRRVRGPVV